MSLVQRKNIKRVVRLKRRVVNILKRVGITKIKTREPAYPEDPFRI